MSSTTYAGRIRSKSRERSRERTKKDLLYWKHPSEPAGGGSGGFNFRLKKRQPSSMRWLDSNLLTQPSLNPYCCIFLARFTFAKIARRNRRVRAVIGSICIENCKLENWVATSKIFHLLSHHYFFSVNDSYPRVGWLNVSYWQWDRIKSNSETICFSPLMLRAR